MAAILCVALLTCVRFSSVEQDEYADDFEAYFEQKLKLPPSQAHKLAVAVKATLSDDGALKATSTQVAAELAPITIKLLELKTAHEQGLLSGEEYAPYRW